MQLPFIDNIWGADIHLISKFNKGFRFLFLTYVIRDLKDEEIVGTLYEKEFRVGKVIKRKGKKLYVKQKFYDSSFNIWIDKKIHERMSISE